MKVLLVGSEGYIGSYIKHSLSSKYEFEYCDWLYESNTKDFRLLSKEYISKFDSLILLAGHSSVKMCENNRSSSFKNNVVNFVDLLDKISKTKLIYASSASVYGNTKNKTVYEEYDTYSPTNYYDISKQIIDLYSSKSDVEYYGLRFGTVNGWSPRVRKDIMINAMVNNSIINGKINLYANKINRAILGIKDLSDSIDKILQCNSDKRGIYNLASFNKTAGEIAYEVADLMGVEVVETQSSDNVYDFSISSHKFSEAFEFTFKETVETITNSLKSKFDQCLFIDRSSPVKYEYSDTAI